MGVPITAGRYDSGVVQNPISKVIFVLYTKCVTEFYALPDNNSSDASTSFGLCSSGLVIMCSCGVVFPGGKGSGSPSACVNTKGPNRGRNMPLLVVH